MKNKTLHTAKVQTLPDNLDCLVRIEILEKCVAEAYQLKSKYINIKYKILCGSKHFDIIIIIIIIIII